MVSIGSRGFRAGWISLACVAVCASSAAAAADYYLKIEGVKGESKAASHKGEIEIQSFSWGATQMGSGGGGSGGLGAGKASMSDLSVMRGPRQTTSQDGTHVAAGDVDGDGRADAAAGSAAAGTGLGKGKASMSDLAVMRSVEAPRDAASGLATGKRTHKPIRMSTASISLTMKLAGCAVGTRYPSAQLTTPDGRYVLHDLVVASCGAGSVGAVPTEQVTLNYRKVTVRGWNPETKEP